MALTPGTRLGVYEITAQIGEGGMGEVYRATDSNLKRSVAIKVLPASVAGDADRLARFQREAEVLAALNHPNIGSIYGLEKTPDFTALVMELVEGEDLSQKLEGLRAQGSGLPLDEALPIAKQIADALEAAHEQGIIHRDLKPANIKVRSDGTVKVLDFGLAKALDQGSGIRDQGSAHLANSPTITTPAMTQAGMILGTAAYMSPEQAKGRVADKRSDVWAFGCVVYELLSSRRAFEGDDVSDTFAAVLRGEPDWTALPPETPAAVVALLRHCLVKDRHQRVTGLAAAQFVLAQPAALISQANPVRMAPAPAHARRRGLIAAVIAALSITAVFAGIVGWRLRPSLPAPPVARFSLVLPVSQLFGSFTRHIVAVSPDGTLIVYVANSRLFLRSIGELDLHALIGSESALTLSNPAFSPDGRSIAYHADGAIRRIAVSGGAAVSVCQSENPNGMTWDATGIVFARIGSGIFRCPSNGGAPERLAAIKDGEQAEGPQLLPDGSSLIFAVAKVADESNRWDRAQIVVQSLKTGQRKTLVTGGSDPRYLPTGHLLYALGGTVFAVPFDPARAEVLGGPVPVVEGVRRPVTFTSSGVAQFSVSRTGTLVYVPGPINVTTESVVLGTADRSGVETRLPAPPGPYVHVRASADGTRLAVGSDDGKEAIVWIYDLAGTSAMRRLTMGGHNRFPIWAPDGQRVAFQSDREGDAAIFVQRADGTGPVQRLTTPAPGDTHIPESWSPDGKVILFSAAKGPTYTLWRLSIGDKDPARFGRVESAEPTGAVFSPDGRWVAYASSPAAGGVITANRGVFVQPYPPTGDVFQAPLQRLDFHPVWARNGAELLYVPTAASGQITVVGVSATPTLSFGAVSSVPARVTHRQPSGSKRVHDILPDGRFVGVLAASGSDQSDTNMQLRVVLNWTEELKTRVPTK